MENIKDLFNVDNGRTIEEIKKQLDRIERLTLLSAKNVLTFDDIVLLTGLSKSYLYKLTMKGDIPHYKPNGKVIYFDRAEVEDWMKQNRIATNKEIDHQANSYIANNTDSRGYKPKNK